MATFYSFKNVINAAEPKIKNPGSVDGQMFDIADCEGSTLVVMDHTEQVQIDQVNNCKVFIGACASSIFIRNCKNCTFYTCCRQLRLREVEDCVFYIFSMSEVHIEYSSKLKFAPFNGGYPEHANHLKAANISSQPNLWYDIYDHNDPNKSGLNWTLMSDSDYEEPWFPAGETCEIVVPKTAPGSDKTRAVEQSMQSFSLQQMMIDAGEKAPATGGPQTAVAIVNEGAAADDVRTTEQQSTEFDADQSGVVDTLTCFAELSAGADFLVRCLSC